MVAKLAGATCAKGARVCPGPPDVALGLETNHGKTQDHRAARSACELRINAEEQFLLFAKAHACGMSVGDYLRSLALSPTVAQRALPTVQVRSRVSEGLVHHLRKIGVNINQIARHCHQTKHAPPPDLEPLLADLRAFLNQAWSRRPDGET